MKPSKVLDEEIEFSLFFSGVGGPSHRAHHQQVRRQGASLSTKTFTLNPYFW